jgi:stearoyl-CoA desaturase (delta-9 desaturase)
MVATPDDWLERNLYSKHAVLGIGIMLAIDLVLFGPIGFIMWGVQMVWIPFFAAGVINGVGHYWGYRNFASSDASTNISPWGILIGGEELHNNHHAYVTSARLSNKWWEFDIGWVYIRALEIMGLATVRNVAPKIRFNLAKDWLLRLRDAASRHHAPLRRAGQVRQIPEADRISRNPQFAGPRDFWPAGYPCAGSG